MDCIPYINDLLIEIDTLEKINNNNPKINEKIQEKRFLIEKCKSNLNRLSNNKIEYRLYLKIINGLKPSKAVEEIANENYRDGIKPTDVSTIWKNYYKKIKKFL